MALSTRQQVEQAKARVAAAQATVAVDTAVLVAAGVALEVQLTAPPMMIKAVAMQLPVL